VSTHPTELPEIVPDGHVAGGLAEVAKEELPTDIGSRHSEAPRPSAALTGTASIKPPVCGPWFPLRKALIVHKMCTEKYVPLLLLGS
jgi:hypothetical protein